MVHECEEIQEGVTEMREESIFLCAEKTEAEPVLEPLQLYTESRTNPALQGK